MLKWFSRIRDHRLALRIHEARFVVLDLETTGLDVAEDRMISASALTIRDAELRLDEVLDLKVRPTTALRAESIPIHGLLARDIEHGLPEHEAVERIESFLGDGVVVGHHIAFDLAVLSRARGGPKPRLSVDTGRLALRLEHGSATNRVERSPPSLDRLADAHGVRVRSRHTAPGDVLATAEVFLWQLAKCRTLGIERVRDLLRS